MMSSSYRVGMVAMFCHASAMLFSKFVEEPFMRSEYGQDLRPVGGLQSEVVKKAELAKKKLDSVLHPASPTSKKQE